MARSADKKYAANKTELAKECGLAYETLLGYFKRPDHPPNHAPGAARYDIEAWRKFIADNKSAHNFGKGQAANGYHQYNEREQSIIDKNKVAAKAAQFDLDVKMGEYIPRITANRQVDTANAIVVREINKAIESELPPRLEGMSAVEIKKALRKKFDTIFAELPKHFEKVK